MNYRCNNTCNDLCPAQGCSRAILRGVLPKRQECSSAGFPRPASSFPRALPTTRQTTLTRYLGCSQLSCGVGYAGMRGMRGQNTGPGRHGITATRAAPSLPRSYESLRRRDPTRHMVKRDGCPGRNVDCLRPDTPVNSRILTRQKHQPSCHPAASMSYST